MTSKREKTYTHTHTSSWNVQCLLYIDGFTVNTQLLELYEAWSESFWTEFIFLLLHITLCWDFSELAFMCSWISSISKTSMQPFSLNTVTTSKCHALYLWCLRPWNNACVSNFVQNLKKHEIKFMIWPWLPFKGRPWAILKFLSSCAALKIDTHLQKMMSVLNIIHLSEMMKW